MRTGRDAGGWNEGADRAAFSARRDVPRWDTKKTLWNQRNALGHIVRPVRDFSTFADLRREDAAAACTVRLRRYFGLDIVMQSKNLR